MRLITKLIETKLAQKAVDKLIAHVQKTPYLHLTGYLERFWLVKPSKHFPFTVLVNHFLVSDQHDELHDHPWDNLSIVLRGGYLEVQPADQKQHPVQDATLTRDRWVRPGEVVFRRATDRHRVQLPVDDTSWSIFIMGPKKRSWGFHTVEGFVNWRDFFTEDHVERVRNRIHKEWQR